MAGVIYCLNHNCGQYLIDIQVRSAYTSPVRKQSLIKQKTKMPAGIILERMIVIPNKKYYY